MGYMTRDLKPLNSPWWFSLPIAGVILGTILVLSSQGDYPSIAGEGVLSSFVWLWVLSS